MANSGVEKMYQEFEAAARWTSEPNAEILVVDLPGFKKDQLKVAVTATRKLRLIGERPTTGGNKWIRFHHEIPVPLNLDIDSVSATFKDNKLYIRHPKVKTQVTQTKPPVIMKPHEKNQGQGTKAAPSSGETEQLKHDASTKEPVGEPRGALSSKDGAKWFEKYKETAGNMVKEARDRRQSLCNLAASILLVLLILLYARNAVRSCLVWNLEE